MPPSGVKRFLLSALIFLGIFSGGCISSTPTIQATSVIETADFTPTIPPRPTPPGTKYDAGGYNLYIECAGAGITTIIFESGLEGDVVTWKSVFPEVILFTRACRYDRAGLAHSDYGPVPRDAQLIADDLHKLLDAANISPPYILVGHSFGGLLIRRFASEYPDEVTGMVFVDSLGTDWWDDALNLLPPPSDSDSLRLRSFRSYLTEGWRDPSNNFEMMNIPLVIEQVQETDGFGNIPITVLTAERFTVINPGLSTDLESSLAGLFKEEQAQLARLSTNGIQVIVPSTGHNIPLENPMVIVQTIQNMLK